MVTLMKRRCIYIFFILGICTFSLLACTKAVPKEGSVEKQQISETVEEPQYPNDEYIVINNGNSVTVLNDNFEITHEFKDMPSNNNGLFSFSNTYYPYMASGFYDISQPLILGKDGSDQENGKYALYSIKDNCWIEEGYDYIYQDLVGYHGVKDGIYYHFNYQGEIVETSDKVKLDTVEREQERLVFDESVYDGGYYVWGEYYVLYQRINNEDVFQLFYHESLLVKNAILTSYQFGDHYFVFNYMNIRAKDFLKAQIQEDREFSISSSLTLPFEPQKQRSIIFGEEGQSIYQTYQDEIIVSVSKDMKYVMESKDNSIIIKDMKHQVKYEWEDKNELTSADNILMELALIPLEYPMETALEDGCFVIVDGIVKSDNKIMDDFINKSEAGEAATVLIAQYMEQGLALTKVDYNNGRYHAIVDDSRSDPSISGQSYHEAFYPYLKIFDENKLKSVMITDDKDLTYSKLMKSMLSSSSCNQINHLLLYYSKEE